MIQRKYYKTIRVIVDSDGGGTPFYIENIDNAVGYFALKKSGKPTHTPNLNYRIDNGEWFEYDVINLPRIEVPAGSRIYLKGNNINGFNRDGSTYNLYLYTTSTGITTRNCNIGGYLTSLLALENFNLINDIPEYAFYGLVSSNTGLKSSNDLITDNIINVGRYGFYNCFSGCTALVTAPTFSNVTTVAYKSFSSCFFSCTALVTAPTFSNVTTVEDYGFGSCFISCTALVTAPTFSNVMTVGPNSFSDCFVNCTALVTAPTFRNVTTVGYFSFGRCFNKCTALVTPPNFRNVTTVGSSTFNECFHTCTSLETIYAPRTSSWSTSGFTNWVDGVPTSGTFYKKKGLEIPTGTSGIPEGWNVVEED